jgi:dihydropteroate synthase
MRAKIVGIVNVTPDSFSDGGDAYHSADALAAIDRCIAQGADIIDIGAESTRPGATPITHEEEWRRLQSVLPNLPRRKNVEFSLDTRHPQSAARAIECGIDWINDVSGFAHADMLEAVRNASCKLVLMHSLSVPADKSIVMDDTIDVVAEIFAFAKLRIEYMENTGIARERIIFDPGIGFGKTAAQSFALIHNIEQFLVLGVPLLVGHSRKSFLGGSLEERDAVTLEISQNLAMHGVTYLRVHDVKSHACLLASLGTL